MPRVSLNREQVRVILEKYNWRALSEKVNSTPEKLPIEAIGVCFEKFRGDVSIAIGEHLIKSHDF